MKVHIRLSLVFFLLSVSACSGLDRKGGGSASEDNPALPNGQTTTATNQKSTETGQPDVNSPVSFSVASVSALPACNETRSGSLAYVMGEKKFYVCGSNAWTAADILPKDSFSIVGRWKFHVDSY